MRNSGQALAHWTPGSAKSHLGCESKKAYFSKLHRSKSRERVATCQNTTCKSFQFQVWVHVIRNPFRLRCFFFQTSSRALLRTLSESFFSSNDFDKIHRWQEESGFSRTRFHPVPGSERGPAITKLIFLPSLFQNCHTSSLQACDRE